MAPKACLAAFLVLAGWRLPAATTAGSLDLRVMTYNLRYASARPPNSWAERRAVMAALIREQAPDVFGTQEGLYAQLKDLAGDLPGYEWIGLGREGGSRGEFMAIFYRRGRFEPMEFDHFWLSDTPNLIGSTTWGNVNRRMVTWVRLRERATGAEFYLWNTHFDHEIEEARRKSAVLLRDRIAAIPRDLPLVLTGDFNCAAGKSRAFETLVTEGGLADTWDLAVRRVNEGVNTFNGFKPPAMEGVRIDWILVRGRATVTRAEIVTWSRGGQLPSDHFPVVVDLIGLSAEQGGKHE